MLHNGLARTERAGDGGGAALGDGEERVDNTLSAVHGAAGDILLGIRARDTHGPALQHGQLMLAALCVAHDGNRLRHGELTALHAHDLAGHAGGHHDLVAYRARLLHRAEHVTGGDLVAGLRHGDKVPLLFAVEGRHVRAARDGVAGEAAHLGQRALDAVVDIVEHTGSKLDGHGHAGCLDHGTRTEPGGLLIDLNTRLVAGHVKDLAYQALRADTHNVGDVRVCQTLGNDKRS